MPLVGNSSADYKTRRTVPENFRSPQKLARRLGLTPLVRRHVVNWPSFVFHYTLGLVPGTPYRFRNGARLAIGRGVDHVPIIEVFFREDYGTIPDGGVIVDLGASIGVFSIYAATKAPRARLYAYEPMGAAFRLMQANVQLNGLSSSITCFNMAIAARDVDRELYAEGRGFHFPTLIPSGDGQQERSIVHCTTLEAILEANQLERIDLLKMDIEGAEYEALYATSTRCLSRIHHIRMEYHDIDGTTRNLNQLTRFLTDNGYRITRVQPVTPTGGNLWADQI